MLDWYEHTVGRDVACVCGKKLSKGSKAYMAVIESLTGFWNKYKVVCSKECALKAAKAYEASVNREIKEHIVSSRERTGV